MNGGGLFFNMKNNKDIELLTKRCREKVKQIFKKHGFVTYRRVGLQKSLYSTMVEAIIKGDVDIKENK